MNQLNPYSPPESDLTLALDVPIGPQLATPSERFVGALVDSLVALGIIMFIWAGFFLSKSSQVSQFLNYQFKY